ncbi:MAG: signal peptidase II [Deltaproteobacteria bacterium RBG_13_43_22]|nr:MAG: signal peptidase II [Deltaproteobacteria bacterium RBG_13_43_22]
MKRYWLLALSFFGVVFLDIVTKEYIITHFPLYYSRTVIPGLFNLVHIQNKGVAFGILGGSAPVWRDILLLLFPIVAMSGILIFAFCYPQHKTGTLLSLGGILGGAMGNLIDRLRFRAVIDFLDLYWGKYHWPAFNVADSAITLGVLFLIFGYMQMEEA